MPNTNSLKQSNTQARWLKMVKTIDFKDATTKIQQLLEEMTEKDNQYIIKSNGQNIAVLLSYNNFQDLTKREEQAQKSFFEMVDELREYNKGVPYEQIEKDVAQAVAEVRQKKYRQLNRQ